MMTAATDDTIDARPCPDCPLCGEAGGPLYQGIPDRWFGAPGQWNLKKCPNLTCGLVWLDPMPTKEDIGKAYRTYYTHQAVASDSRRPVLQLARSAYLQGRFGYSQGLGPRWHRYLAPLAAVLLSAFPGARDGFADTACHLPARPAGARLLEVGSGNGVHLARMRALGWDVEGLDLDPDAVRVAQGQGLDVRLGELSTETAPSQAYDAVYLSHIIEHVHEPIEFLRECRRVLKPGGRLVIITPNSASWCHRHFGVDWFLLDPPRHLTLFDPTSLRLAAQAAGFDVDRLWTSSRIAILAWISSVEARRYGHLQWVAGWPPLGRTIRAVLAQFGESALLRLRPDAGEEIVLVAARGRTCE